METGLPFDPTLAVHTIDEAVARAVEEAAAAAEAEGAARGREQALREVATRLAAAGVDAEVVQKVLASMRG